MLLVQSTYWVSTRREKMGSVGLTGLWIIGWARKSGNASDPTTSRLLVKGFPEITGGLATF